MFDVVFGHKPPFCSNSLKFSWVLFEVFIKSPVQYYIDFKALDLTNFHDFRFSEQGQAVGGRFYELFAMLSAFILYASTVVDPDIQALRVGNINYGRFIKDMGML